MDRTRDDAFSQPISGSSPHRRELDEERIARQERDSVALANTQQAKAQQIGQTIRGDASAWARIDPYSGLSWPQVVKSHPEVAKHFYDAYGLDAAQAPAAWNAAQVAQTGDSSIGEPVPAGMKLKGATVDQEGHVRRQYVPGEAGADTTYDQLTKEERAYADAIGTYQAPFPGTRGGLPPAMRARVIAALYDKYGPESESPYDAKEYQARQKALDEFKSGRAAENIKSLQTAIHHIGGLKKAADSLGNTDVLPGALNPAKNTVGRIVSSGSQAKQADFNTRANAVASELARVFQGNAPALSQIKEWRQSINTDMSPEAIDRSISAALDLLGGRMDALEEQWHQGVKGPRTLPFLTPENKRILKTLGHEDALRDSVSGGQSGGQESPQEDKFETGKTYTDGKGNKAIYKGNGEWQPTR